MASNLWFSIKMSSVVRPFLNTYILKNPSDEAGFFIESSLRGSERGASITLKFVFEGVKFI